MYTFVVLVVAVQDVASPPYEEYPDARDRIASFEVSLIVMRSTHVYPGLHGDVLAVSEAISWMMLDAPMEGRRYRAGAILAGTFHSAY